MIKKRLLALMAESKTYIIQNIFWQWLGLLSSIITMGTAGWLFQTVWDGAISLSDCLPAAIVIFLCVGLRACCSRRASAASANAGNDVKQELRRCLYEKLTRLGSSYHEKVPTAEAVQVAVEGVEQLEGIFWKIYSSAVLQHSGACYFVYRSLICQSESQFRSFHLCPADSSDHHGRAETGKAPSGPVLGNLYGAGRQFPGKSSGADHIKNLSGGRAKGAGDGSGSRAFPKNHHEGSDACS